MAATAPRSNSSAISRAVETPRSRAYHRRSARYRSALGSPRSSPSNHACSSVGLGPQLPRGTPSSSRRITIGTDRDPFVRCRSRSSGKASLGTTRSSAAGCASTRRATTGSEFTASPHQSSARTRSRQDPPVRRTRLRASSSTLVRRATSRQSSAVARTSSRNRGNPTPDPYAASYITSASPSVCPLPGSLACTGKAAHWRRRGPHMNFCRLQGYSHRVGSNSES